MINFLQVLNKNKEVVFIIDAANSIIWHSRYYGVGDFEIYMRATPEALVHLAIGNYISREDESEIGIIEEVDISFSLESGYMLTVIGRFVKSILDRRHVFALSENLNLPTLFVSNTRVESAARQLVLENAIDCTFNSQRNIPDLALDADKGLPAIIVDEDGNPAPKQISCENLLTCGDELLKEYHYGAWMKLRRSDGKFLYEVYSGADRSFDNTDGNIPIVFSTDFDNLNSCEYSQNDAPKKNAAVIGGAGEDSVRFFTYLSTGTNSGLELRETYVDASAINRTYVDEGTGTEEEYEPEDYTNMLNQEAQNALSQLTELEAFGGNINVNSETFKYKRDFFLGDVVSIQDNYLNKYVNVRVAEVTEVQDENGYHIEINFENERV